MKFIPKSKAIKPKQHKEQKRIHIHMHVHICICTQQLRGAEKQKRALIITHTYNIHKVFQPRGTFKIQV